MKKCNMCGNTVNDSLPVCPNCGSNNLQPLNNVANNLNGGINPQVNMPNQPMPNLNQQMPIQGNMPMTYATVFMALIGMGAVSNLCSSIKDFSIATLIAAAFAGLTIFFLYKRTKVGRILAMVYSVFEAIAGFFFLILGALLSLSC